MSKKSTWRIYRVTFTQSQIDAMTLEDFGPPLDEEDKEILRGSGIALHHKLASDDPAIRLQACKDSLARLCG
jgi:hypothetical protein